MSKMDKVEHYDKDTGEELLQDVIESNMKDDFYKKVVHMKYMLENKPEELNTEEIEEAVKTVNGFTINDLKQYESFVSYYTANKDKLNEALDNLSDQAYKCLSILVVRYTSCDNTIQFKNHVNIVKDAKFIDILSLSPSKWSRVKKELIEKGCIRRIKLDKKIIYKINPTVIGHSMRITKCTYYAFRNELAKEFELHKRVYWDKQILEEFGHDILDQAKKVK